MNLLTQRGLNRRLLLSVGFAGFAGLTALIVAVSLRAMRSTRSDAFVLSHKTADEVAACLESRLASAYGTVRHVST